MPTFGVGHQAARAQNLAQRTDDAHGVRGSNHDVKGHVAGLDHGSQVVHADDVSTSGLGFFSLGTLGKHGHALGLAGAVGQHDGAAHHLIRLLGINAELHRHVDGFIEFGGGTLFDEAQSVGQGIQLVAVDLALEGFLFFGELGHLNTLHIHAHRTGRAGDGTNRCIHVGSGQVFHFGLGDFFELGAGDLADLDGLRRGRALVNLDGLLDQDRRRRRS